MLLLTLFLASCSLLSMAGAQFIVKCSYFFKPKVLIADSQVKSFRLPFDAAQSYLPNQHCEWTIRAENPNNVIELFVNECDIEGPNFRDECVRDYLDIYDVKSGESVYMARLCGRKAEGKLLESSSSEMIVHFISDTRFQFSGFRLSYMAQPKKPKESDDDSAVELAVGIPIGIILLCLVVILTVLFYRRRSKSSAHHQPSREQHGPTLHPQLVISEMTNYHRSAELNYMQHSYTPYNNEDDANIALDLQDNSHNLPLQMSLPEYSAEVPPQETSLRSPHRFSALPDSSSPTDVVGAPPSYDFVVRNDHLSGSGDPTMLQLPPDYESVVREQSFGCGDRQSSM